MIVKALPDAKVEVKDLAGDDNHMLLLLLLVYLKENKGNPAQNGL